MFRAYLYIYPCVLVKQQYYINIALNLFVNLLYESVNGDDRKPLFS